MPPEVLARIQPEYVTPLVLKLCHESHSGNGEIFEVGGGWISAVRWEQSRGVTFDLDSMTPEAIAANWATITDFSNAVHRNDVAETMAEISRRIGLSIELAP